MTLHGSALEEKLYMSLRDRLMKTNNDITLRDHIFTHYLYNRSSLVHWLANGAGWRTFKIPLAEVLADSLA